MISRATRALINALSFVMLCWIGLVIYQSIAGGRIWDAVDGVLERPAGTFSVLAFAGMLPLAGIGWVIWRLFLRGRPAEDFPAASLKARR
jgi:hypothetical protein